MRQCLHGSAGPSGLSGRQQCRAAHSGVSRRTVQVHARATRYDRRKPPPPDLPSLLFDQRIVYLGMPLVPAVTELMVAELLYLEKQGQTLPIEMLINSSGTTRQDGEILAFDSEGIALTSTMGFIRNPISTVNMGLAVGWSCAVLAFGKKGWRKSLPHSLAMIQQPRVPPTGARQAIEVHIKWREVLDYKREYLRMLSIGTGWPVDKLDADMQRPLYMRPQDAIQYNIIDEVIQPDMAKSARAELYWIKSGRAESDGRLEQWYEYLSLQEQYALKDQWRKAVASGVREENRQQLIQALEGTQYTHNRLQRLREMLPAAMLDGDDVKLPMSKLGIQTAILNAERYADRNIQRHLTAGLIEVPQRWKDEGDALDEQALKDAEARWQALHQANIPLGVFDIAEVIKVIDAMDPEQFEKTDLNELLTKHTVQLMPEREAAAVSSA